MNIILEMEEKISPNVTNNKNTLIFKNTNTCNLIICNLALRVNDDITNYIRFFTVNRAA